MARKGYIIHDQQAMYYLTFTESAGLTFSRGKAIGI